MLLSHQRAGFFDAVSIQEVFIPRAAEGINRIAEAIVASNVDGQARAQG
jgi:hypothetical protein